MNLRPYSRRDFLRVVGAANLAGIAQAGGAEELHPRGR